MFFSYEIESYDDNDDNDRFGFLSSRFFRLIVLDLLVDSIAVEANLRLFF